MAEVLIAPSILAADFARLGEEVGAVEAAGADWIHLDVMDGHFVPNISFGAAVVASLRPLTSKPLDVHLMIAPADPYIADFAKAGADGITVHAEAGPHVHRTLGLIREHGVRAGVALNPATPLQAVAHVLDLVDLVLVMTVNPGFGGQAFIEPMLGKIAEVRAAIAGRPIRVGADGGINRDVAGRCAAAGADVLVAGSAVFGAKSYSQAIAELRAAARGPTAAGSRRQAAGSR